MPMFGMPTLLETRTLEECVALCKQLGLSFIELNMNLPLYQLSQLDPVRLQKIAKQAGIFYTIHLDENLNVSDFNPYVADSYRRTVKETIEPSEETANPGSYDALVPRSILYLAGKKGLSVRSISGRVHKKHEGIPLFM